MPLNVSARVDLNMSGASQGNCGFPARGRVAPRDGDRRYPRAHEVQRVNEYLDQHGRPEIGMILKIETRRAFAHLPGMLLAALGINGRRA